MTDMAGCSLARDASAMGQRLEWEVHRTTEVVWLTVLLVSAPEESPGGGCSAACVQRGGGDGRIDGSDPWIGQVDAGRGGAAVREVMLDSHQFPHLLQMSQSADEGRKSRQGSAPSSQRISGTRRDYQDRVTRNTPTGG